MTTTNGGYLRSVPNMSRSQKSGGEVLITGGAGYVGSHCAVALAHANYSPVIVDNMANSSMESIRRVESLVGKRVPVHCVDLNDRAGLEAVFQQHSFECVLHLAGLKAVGESCQFPLKYYHANVAGTITLLEVMDDFGVRNIVFSSSATVYGDPKYVPMDEKHPVGDCTSPYGKSKFFIEEIIRDQCAAEKAWNAIILRYFNPVGAHESGRIGEDPSGIPHNLMPYVGQVAVGKRPFLNVYGDDFDTPDGTGRRDYIHVMDLAEGHVAAVTKLEEEPGFKVYNLGSGKARSVLEIVRAFVAATGCQVPYKIMGRRPGDVPTMLADATLAEQELHWKAKRSLEEICQDMWRWLTLNPSGYSEAKSG